MKLFTRSLIFVMCGLALASPASALINVTPSVTDVWDKPVSLDISNDGDRPEFVSITLSRLFNPGVEFADERMESIVQVTQPKLYATPFKLMLAPGQSKKITIKPLLPVAEEQVYRIDIKPVVNLIDPKLSSLAGNVVVNLAYSSLVRHLPEKETSTLTVKCEADGARFFASGTTRVHVKDVTVDGKPSESFNVYPGVPILVKGTKIKIPQQAGCSPPR